MPNRPSLLIVTPALAAANNGNWQTARRWARLLGDHCHVRLLPGWQGEPGDAMIALHARRSAAAIAGWAATGHPVAVVLTGTDLYRDIDDDPAAQRSLALADRLVVLQSLGVGRLPAAWQAKTRVCLQSTTSRQPQPKSGRYLRLIAVGHLRAEKSPETVFALADRFREDPAVRIDHLGGPLDPALGVQAQALAARLPGYRWLGNQSHEATRRRIARAHLLVHPSQMEGGAHVIMEAICSGTPVLASRIDGNLGLLGEDYPGYFPFGDIDALVALVTRCRTDPSFLPDLAARSAARAPLFGSRRERTNLLALVAELLPGWRPADPQS